MGRLYISLACILIYSTTLAQLIEKEKIIAPDRVTGDNFGRTVSIDGNLAIVGAPNNSFDSEGGGPELAGAGAAYIYEKQSNGDWHFVQKITAADRNSNDKFGWSVSISGDYALVGAYYEDDFGGVAVLNAGSAYIYRKEASGLWVQHQKIAASDRGFGDQFGWALNISGNHLVVGAHAEDDDENNQNYLDGAGSVYVFEKNSSDVWVETQKIVASDRAQWDYFGYSVSIDDSVLIVGANGEDEDALGLNTLNEAGSAYVYEKNSSGLWVESAKLNANDRGINDQFGISVDVSKSRVIVGVSDEDEDENGLNTMTGSGAAYIFEKNGVGDWYQQNKLVATDRAANDGFGWSVSICDSLVVVSAPYEDEDDSGLNTLATAGSAYLFKKNPSGIWEETQKIISSDRESADFFGVSVALSVNSLIIGAMGEDHDTLGLNEISLAGSAYLFNPECTISHSSITVEQCDSYISPSGNYVWSSSGTYSDTIVNSDGCDSVILINLTIQNVNVGVIQNGPELTAQATNVSYQWLDCDDSYVMILGATSQAFTPTYNGNFAVLIEDNGCMDTSVCFTVNTLDLESIKMAKISVYPNPTSDNVTLDAGGLDIEHVEIRDHLGRIVMDSKYPINGHLEINLSEFIDGVYYIFFYGKDRIIIPFVKQ